MKVSKLRTEIVGTSTVFSGKDVKVTFTGDSASTDGKSVNLPVMPESANVDDKLVKLMRGFVDHETSHIRNSDMFSLTAAANKGKEFSHLFQSIEDSFIEQKAMREYRGSTKNIMGAADVMYEHELEGAKFFDGKVTSQSIAMACRTAHRQGRGSYTVDQTWDTLSPRARAFGQRVADICKRNGNSKKSLAVTERLKFLMESDPDLSSTSPMELDPETEMSEELQKMLEEMAEAEAEGKGEGSGESEAGGDGEGSGEGNGDGEGEGEEKGEQERGGSGVSTEFQEEADEWKPQDLGEAINNSIKRYPTKGEYVVEFTHLDKVFDRNFRHPQSNGYDTIKGSCKGAISVLKNRFQRLLLSKLARDYDFGREDGRLDSKRLVAAYSGSRSVYKKPKDRPELDTAVTILVDLSGSMSGQKMELATQSCVAIAEALNNVAIPFSIMGFTTTGQGYRTTQIRGEAMAMYIPKDFNDSLNSSKKYIAAFDNEIYMLNNIDACSVRFAKDHLAKREEKRKVLFVLSDGQPAHRTGSGFGYRDGPDIMSKGLREAVQECQEEGIETFGLGIRSDAVSEYYPKSQVVWDIDELSQKTFKAFNDLILKD